MEIKDGERGFLHLFIIADRSSGGSTILSSVHNCREKTAIKTPENHLIQEFMRKRVDIFFRHLFLRKIFFIASELYIKMIPMSLKSRGVSTPLARGLRLKKVKRNNDQNEK